MTINNNVLESPSVRQRNKPGNSSFGLTILWVRRGQLEVQTRLTFNAYPLCRKNFDRSFYICALVVALWTSAVVGSLRNKSSKSKVRNVVNDGRRKIQDTIPWYITELMRHYAVMLKNGKVKIIVHTNSHLNLNEQHYSMIFLVST